MAAWFGFGSAPADLVQLLERWRRRQPERTVARDGMSPRVGPAAGGLLAGLARRGLRHARVRVNDAGGRVILGEHDIVHLPIASARACMASLREAASLPACSPHAAGSFGVLGRVARVEVYACHDGERAFVHVAGDGEAVLDAPLRLLAEMDAEALLALRGSTVEPEDLLAALMVATSGDSASVLARHADVTLLATQARLPIAGRLASSLEISLCDAVAGPNWRLAWEPIAECATWVRGCAEDVTEPVLSVLRGCRKAATPEAHAGLRAAFSPR